VAEGTFHEVKGKIKEIAREQSDNTKFEAEGTDEKIVCLCFNTAKIA
jgi:uncharacterized protein YjbJ (UPF0337 family)